MEGLNINNILNREDKANNIKDILKEFELNKNNILEQVKLNLLLIFLKK